MWFYILLAILIVVFMFLLFGRNKENFTIQQQEFSEQLASYFQKGEILTFTKYLLVLTQLENTSDNLISKGVYNKFSQRAKNLTANEILQSM